MRFRKLLFIPLFIIIMVLTLNISLKATNRYMTLNVDLEDNYLIFVYSDIKNDYNYPLIRTDTFDIVNRINNNYYFYPNTDIESDLDYSIINLYCFHLDYVSQGVDDYALNLRVFRLIPQDFTDTTSFELIHYVDIENEDFGSYGATLYIDYENVIDIQNYSGVSVNITGELIYQYLLGNPMNPTASTLGLIIEDIKRKAFSDGEALGFQDGYEFANGGIVKSFVNPIFTFFDNFFSIEIGPNITIGNIVLIPLILGIIGLVLYFWRKD